MYTKYCLLCLLVLFTLLEIRKSQECSNFVFNLALTGFRLHAPVLMTKVVSEKLFCLMECCNEPCCRSINYKKTFGNESNCELLHHMVYNTSENALEKNDLFDHVSLVNPEKSYNDSCFTSNLETIVKAPGEMSSCHSTKLIKKGCYRDFGSNGTGERPLPTQLQQYPEEVDWRDGWDDYIYNVTCHCANKAKSGGYRYYGVQNYRECWTGILTPEYFNINEKAKKCWGVRPNYNECNDDAETACVGPPDYNYIYEII